MPKDPAPIPEIPATDIGNAIRLMAEHGLTIRYCPQRHLWYFWTGTHWQEDDRLYIPALIRDLAADLLRRAVAEHDLELAKHAMKFHSAARLAACEQVARTLAGLHVFPHQLDQHPFLLACPNGTVDLTTGSLVPVEPSHYLTRLCPTPYSERASCAKWEAFLEQILPDEPTRLFVQRYLGHSLTGSMVEQVFGIFHGTGANGKTTLVETVRRVMGPLAGHVPPEVFRPAYGNPHPVGQMTIIGLRLALVSETEQNQGLTEALIKALTGGEETQARGMRENYISFQPTAKYIICCNHLPKIRGTDNGIWRRIVKVPFTEEIPPERQDKDLQRALLAEAEGILSWLVRGALMWQMDGLQPPAAVREATAAYRSAEDTVESFVDEHIALTPGARAETGEVFRRWQGWLVEQGYKPNFLPRKELTHRLEAHGAELKKSNGKSYLVGISLITPSVSYEDFN